MHNLSIPELAECCHTEQLAHPDSSPCCLELFRRALVLDDQEAWDAVEKEFKDKVKGWVYTYSRFWQTGETADNFVSEAFVRLWQSGRKRAREGRFACLGGYLDYLKRCAWSAIEDCIKKLKKDALWYALNERDNDDDGDTILGFLPEEPQGDSELEIIFLVLREITQEDPRKCLVAEESWVYGFSPQDIQSRHPELFRTVAQVSDIKKKIIHRLKNHPKITNLFDE